MAYDHDHTRNQAGEEDIECPFPVYRGFAQDQDAIGLIRSLRALRDKHGWTWTQACRATITMLREPPFRRQILSFAPICFLIESLDGEFPEDMVVNVQERSPIAIVLRAAFHLHRFLLDASP